MTQPQEVLRNYQQLLSTNNSVQQTSFSSMVLNNTEIRSSNNLVSQQTNILRRRKKDVVQTVTTQVIFLFQKENKLYVGGDRDEPELIYELEDGHSFMESIKISKTDLGFIVNFITKKSVGEYYLHTITGDGQTYFQLDLPQVESEGILTFNFKESFAKTAFENGYFSYLGVANSDDITIDNKIDQQGVYISSVTRDAYTLRHTGQALRTFKISSNPDDECVITGRQVRINGVAIPNFLLPENSTYSLYTIDNEEAITPYTFNKDYDPFADLVDGTGWFLKTNKGTDSEPEIDYYKITDNIDTFVGLELTTLFQNSNRLEAIPNNTTEYFMSCSQPFRVPPVPSIPIRDCFFLGTDLMRGYRIFVGGSSGGSINGGLDSGFIIPPEYIEVSPSGVIYIYGNIWGNLNTTEYEIVDCTGDNLIPSPPNVTFAYSDLFTGATTSMPTSFIGPKHFIEGLTLDQNLLRRATEVEVEDVTTFVASGLGTVTNGTVIFKDDEGVILGTRSLQLRGSSFPSFYLYNGWSSYDLSKSFHRAFSVNVLLETPEVSTDQIVLGSGGESNLPFDYLPEKTVNTRQESRFSFVEPLLVGVDQESALIREYNEETEKFDYRLYFGESSVLLTEDKFVTPEDFSEDEDLNINDANILFNIGNTSSSPILIGNTIVRVVTSIEETDNAESTAVVATYNNQQSKFDFSLETIPYIELIDQVKDLLDLNEGDNVNTFLIGASAFLD